ncbi:MAG: NAD(P)-dependent oxidoreductase [Alphaproteobacteria bacterium BRH_c36]|nr:MAG: NAD(P)-dependent oxidoreductase [Alphaproteobacteria bacterium BRH_c36]
MTEQPRDPPTDEEPKLPGLEAELDPKPEWQPRFAGSDRLRDKVAVVTGGDSGIGRAVAVLFAREGASVAIAYLNEDEDAERTKTEVEKEGGSAMLFRGDLGSAEQCKDLIDKTNERFGRIDILVNNAGEQHPDDDLDDITETQLRRTFQTNVFSMFFLTQAALAHLSRGAAIINTTSVTMYKGSAGLLDYSATKGAITAFTRSLSQNLADRGIRVNAVAPGPIWTPLNPCGGKPADEIPDFGKSTPMGRPGQPNEVAPCFLFLASDDSSYMSGQVLHPNGGVIVAS